jgi:hypothetical protein
MHYYFRLEFMPMILLYLYVCPAGLSLVITAIGFAGYELLLHPPRK